MILTGVAGGGNVTDKDVLVSGISLDPRGGYIEDTPVNLRHGRCLWGIHDRNYGSISASSLSLHALGPLRAAGSLESNIGKIMSTIAN